MIAKEEAERSGYTSCTVEGNANEIVFIKGYD